MCRMLLLPLLSVNATWKGRGTSCGNSFLGEGREMKRNEGRNMKEREGK